MLHLSKNPLGFVFEEVLSIEKIILLRVQSDTHDDY